MFKVAVFVLALVAVSYARQVPGAPIEDEDNNNSYADTLGKILTDAEIHVKVKSIENVRRGVVGGMESWNIVDFVSGDNQKCVAKWVVKFWESQKPSNVQVSCK